MDGMGVVKTNWCLWTWLRKWWNMDSFQWIVDCTDEQIPNKNYELWLWLLGENLTSRSLWSCDLSSDTRPTPFLQQVFHEVCVSLIKIGFLCLLSVIVFKGGLGIGNFNKHPTISSNAVGKLAKTQQWSHFTFRSSHPRAFSKLFILGITKGANRGHIYNHI